jgi:hypothetical protein
MSRTPLVSFATRSDEVAARLVEDAVAVGVAVQEKDIELAVGVAVADEDVLLEVGVARPSKLTLTLSLSPSA